MLFVLPLLVLALVGYGVYKLVHRQPHPVHGAVETVAPVDHNVFWPTTLLGRLGIAAFVVGLLFNIALVNVIQVPFLVWALALASVVMTGTARLRMHDRSTSVLVVLVLAAIGVVLAGLFLAGELFIGH